MNLNSVPGKYTQLGYKAATYARSNGVAPAQNVSADADIRYDGPTLRAESRRMFNDNGLYASVINRLTDNVIGGGFSLQARTSDEDVNDTLESLWEDFTESPEITDKFDWYEVERLVLQHILIDGDVGLLKTNAGLLQIIEANRIFNAQAGVNTTGNHIENGIEVDSLGKLINFYVSDYVGYGTSVSPGKPYSASDMIFIANRDRASQTRGVPKLVSVMPIMHMIMDILTSEAISWQTISKFAMAIKRMNGPEQAYQESDVNTDSTSASDLPARVQQFDFATIVNLQPGEDIESIKREIPSMTFEQSILVFIRLLGLPVGLPLELTMLNYQGLNYSSARASLNQAYKAFNCIQRGLKNKLHKKVYKWKVQEWVTKGLVPNLPDIFNHNWTTPSFPFVDPLKETESFTKQIDTGISSLTEVLSSLNKDPDAVIAQRELEVTKAIELAQKIKEATGVEVPWQIFAGVTTPNTPAVVTDPLATENDNNDVDSNGNEISKEDVDEASRDSDEI